MSLLVLPTKMLLLSVLNEGGYAVSPLPDALVSKVVHSVVTLHVHQHFQSHTSGETECKDLLMEVNLINPKH